MLALVSAGSAAQDVKSPHLSFAPVDWPAAIATLSNVDALPPPAMSVEIAAGRRRAARCLPALARLNGVMSQQFAGVATSPVPVLLPFDVDALLRDQAAGAGLGGAERYLSGFHAATFFYPGPAGYDAAFAIRTSDVPELSDIKFAEPIEVQISGSALLYDLDAPIAAEGQPVAGLEEEFPGIRRMILEHHLRYTFVRFGVPYVVSIDLLRRRRLALQDADLPGRRSGRAALPAGVARGRRNAADASAPAKPLPIERPARVSHIVRLLRAGPAPVRHRFSRPGRPRRTTRSIRRSAFRSTTRRPSPVRRCTSAASRTHAAESGRSARASATPWRDNFCERRGFPVGQCPAGIGHQGQDIRPGPCKPPPGMERCTHHGNIVAVRDGVILRSPRQEAAYLFVNSANEHIRFRYLHMNPRKMDEDSLLSGRRVHEGEIIGEVSNFSMKEAGTSYHVHFDVQVPTKVGWVFVNPYMTLVAAYERLIGERGTELADPSVVATADPASTGVDSAD